MGKDEIILLNNHVSMFGQRVRIALAEKGVDEYENIEQDLFDKDPLLLQMNPVHKKVPVLIHNGKPLCESLIIVEYIDEVWKDTSPLLPSHPYQRAQARFWARFIDEKVYWSGRKLWESNKKAGEKELEEAGKEFMEVLKVLEGELGEKPFFGGDSFGFLDLCFITYYNWFYTYEQLGGFSVEEHCPKLIEWGKRCMARPSVSASLAHPNVIYDFVLEVKKMLGLFQS